MLRVQFYPHVHLFLLSSNTETVLRSWAYILVASSSRERACVCRTHSLRSSEIICCKLEECLAALGKASRSLTILIWKAEGVENQILGRRCWPRSKNRLTSRGTRRDGQSKTSKRVRSGNKFANACKGVLAFCDVQALFCEMHR